MSNRTRAYKILSLTYVNTLDIYVNCDNLVINKKGFFFLKTCKTDLMLWQKRKEVSNVLPAMKR